MTAPESEDHQPERRRVLHGRRTRIAAAVMGCLVSLGVPIAALSTPTLTVDQQPARAPDDPAGLGTTSVVPGEATSETGEAGSGLPTPVPPTDSTSAPLPGIPTPPNLPDGPLGIPGVVLDAYQFAQRTLAETRPACHLHWALLAGIGRIESNHASDGRLDAFGNTLGPILGPRLDGSPGVAAIPDTDHGVLDGDTVWDRAVGPMQFIPSTWRSVGADGNGDGVANPNNIYDSTVAAGLYLCAGEANLSDPAQLRAAVFRYNQSDTYVDVVLEWAHAYLTGVVPMPSAPGPVPPGVNGNGGRVIPPEPVRPATPAPVVVAQAAPAMPAPSTALSPPPPAVATPTPTPAVTPIATSNPPSPSPTLPVTTPPVTTPPATESPAPMASPAPTESPAPRDLPSPSPVSTVSPTRSPTPLASPTPAPSPPARTPIPTA